jgi:hypothetical protein
MEQTYRLEQVDDIKKGSQWCRRKVGKGGEKGEEETKTSKTYAGLSILFIIHSLNTPCTSTGA